jgi:hypothetical protein
MLEIGAAVSAVKIAGRDGAAEQFVGGTRQAMPVLRN